MTYNIIVILIIVISFAADIYLYQKNQNLLKAIDNADKICTREIVAIGQRHKKQTDESLMIRRDQTDMEELSHGSVKSSLDKMVSYGHLLRAVSNKYEFLLESVQISASDKKQLLQNLIEREKLNGVTFQSLVETDDAERADYASRLDSAEDHIKELLKDPVDYNRYQYLKDKSL
jgi:archaellum component FlaF (FlaF/FlaG flagellin family)